MYIHPQKLEHIEKEAFRILELLEEVEDTSNIQRSPKGSIAHHISVDLTDKLVDRPIREQTTLAGETVSIQDCHKGKCIRLSEENYKEYKKFLSIIYKERSIETTVSYEFLENVTFNWLIKTFKNKKADSDFTSHLLSKVDDSIEEVKIHFSMLHLDIESVLQVGQVKFEFFTKTYFDLLSEEFRKENPSKQNNHFEELRSRYQGRVYATFTTRAERGKAKEIAFEKCSLAVDVLKICSETLDIPNIKLSFDIDNRTRESIQNELIITKPAGEPGYFTITNYRNPNHYVITNAEWLNILKRQFPIYNNFISELSNDPSELEQLIINSIKRFGDAMSTISLHQRVVELYTMLESLLLPDKNSQIIDSVSKYCSKLVFKEPDQRNDLTSLLKLMYEVRSDLIHHAKMRKFELHDLRKLQYAVSFLLCELISKTNKHKSKLSILKEIDDAILKAY